MTGVTKGSFALVLGTLLCAFLGTCTLIARAAKGLGPLTAARVAVLVIMAAMVPVVFDPHSGDVFNLPKYTVVVLGALVVLGLWAVDTAYRRAAPAWRNGLHWFVGAIALWAAVTSATSLDWRVSLLGNYGSYDGLYSTAAFAIVMMAAADVFAGGDNKPRSRYILQAMAFAGGSVVAVYGLVQLHDSEFHSSTWDFIAWHTGSFVSQVFSTFGNPNHLAGFLVIALPAVLVFGLSASNWWWRGAAALLALADLTELARSAARGAWLAAIVELAVLGLMLAPELLRRPALTLGTAGAALVVAIGTLTAFGQRFLHVPLSSLFTSGGTSSVAQRGVIWRTAVDIASEHPVVGTGPDTFAIVYPRYQGATWVKDFGPNYLVNGAHDIFMNILSDQGFVGLLLFLALLAYIGLRSLGAWRRLRRAELDLGQPGARDGRSHRMVLAVVTSGIVAYLVQAAFNVQQVGLTFLFWLLVGVLAAVTTDAGVPSTLRPRALIEAAGPPAELDGSRQHKVPAHPPAIASRRHRGRAGHRGLAEHWPLIATAVASLAVVIVLAIGADAAYRADHDYWAAATSLGQSSTSYVGTAFFTDMEHAISLNPWEPTYPSYEATIYDKLAGGTTSASRLTYLSQARSLAAKAEAIAPREGQYPAEEAQIYLQLAVFQPSTKQEDLNKAEVLAQKAVKDNPRNTAYGSLLRTIASERR